MVLMKLNRQKMKNRMILKGWNLSDLARELKTSREWARQLMDEEKDVRLTTVQKLADVLGFPDAKDLVI